MWNKIGTAAICVVVGALLLGSCWTYKITYDECRNFGHSRLYCYSRR